MHPHFIPFERLTDEEYAAQSYDTICNFVVLMSLDEPELRRLHSPPWYDIGLEAWSDASEVTRLLKRSDVLRGPLDVHLAHEIRSHVERLLSDRSILWTVDEFSTAERWADSRRIMRSFVDRLGLTGVPYSK